VSSKDIFQQSLPSGICQAALLNVIFVFYTGVSCLPKIVIYATKLGTDRALDIAWHYAVYYVALSIAGDWFLQ